MNNNDNAINNNDTINDSSTVNVENNNIIEQEKVENEHCCETNCLHNASNMYDIFDKYSDNYPAPNHSLGVAEDGTQSFAFIEFKGHRRELFLNHNNFELKNGDKVVVTAETGFDLGKILLIKQAKEEDICRKFNRTVTKTIVSKAKEQDLDKEYLNRCEEEEVVSRAGVITQSFGLEMKVVDAEWQLDKQKLTIFFTAPQRVDFRELVKELARQFKTRIELRQITAREETKRIGSGLGCCGQTLCCISFLTDFNKITIEHAKLQQLSTNASKLSGNCKRLKCCMSYEYENYKKELEKYPEINSTIKTSTASFLVSKIDIFKNLVSLFNENERKCETVTYEALQKLIKAGRVIPPVVTESDTQRIIIDDEVVIDDDF